MAHQTFCWDPCMNFTDKKQEVLNLKQYSPSILKTVGTHYENFKHMHLKFRRADNVLAVFKIFIIPLSQPEALTLTPVSTFLHKFPCMNLNLFCLLKLISCQTLIINKKCTLKPIPWKLCLSKPVFYQNNIISLYTGIRQQFQQPKEIKSTHTACHKELLTQVLKSDLPANLILLLNTINICLQNIYSTIYCTGE